MLCIGKRYCASPPLQSFRNLTSEIDCVKCTNSNEYQHSKTFKQLSFFRSRSWCIFPLSFFPQFLVTSLRSWNAVQYSSSSLRDLYLRSSLLRPPFCSASAVRRIFFVVFFFCRNVYKYIF